MSAEPGDIRYVCLSDLHLGEADSILTPLRPGSREVDTGAAGPTLEQLVVCLEHVLAGNQGDRRPILILNGDVLELAFGSFSQALNNFARLVRTLLERELFERLVYIPGNHDHHIWEVARETQYASVITDKSGRNSYPPLRHVTSPRLTDAVPAYLLNKVIEQVHPAHGSGGLDHEVLVVYPNLAFVDEAEDRCVLFHHGHYVEPLYHAFSKLRRWLFPDRPRPETIDEIEEENFAWIEFVWSLLGRSGGAGADMRLLFRMLRDESEFEAFTEALARRISAATDIPYIPGKRLERLVLKTLFGWIGPRISGERSRRSVVFSPELQRGVQDYLFGPAFLQLEGDLGRIPADLTFVFGHTHKPFESSLADPDGSLRTRLYNTGGWPIDSQEPSDAMGASILFMNEGLEIAALRVYNDGDPDGEVSLEVRCADLDEPGSEFRDAVRSRLRDSGGAALAPQWARLESLIHDAIARRRRHHLEESA